MNKCVNEESWESDHPQKEEVLLPAFLSKENAGAFLS